ncbi:fumarate reductase [Vespertiliibacter pulmonis]|uniref:L-aspartate oxidase n=1 Tax=Vespertiliibacter pulmonis TaxID=1443036 RepID=A0A3N4WKR4_9PAST|nr:FAD-binding protein [Vespertiliibacter pulmonis]QLB21305.1 fumarate reductase [Vespertiliibacter pulmonis]RPE85714.1 succinate dehydrogenase/fumarate reductase flavoprotein subunit [Vespertiliibacter pulmonis]
MNGISISRTIETELLVIGSGIAGLASCVEARSKGIQVVLISKTPIGSGASYFPLKATLGIQVTGGKQDYLLFQEDIERVAQGVNNPKIVKAYIEESAESIELLNRIGFEPWQRKDNRPACFARYARPVFLINNWRDSAERAKKIIADKNISFYENATLIHIEVDNNQVQGAIFSCINNGNLEYIFCRTSQIILATGGIAGLYKDNLYPADIIGSSHYVAQQAGAKLKNLEFLQFIPSFVEPKYKVLFGEHTLKYVEKVTDNAGNNLFPHLTPQDFHKMMVERSDYAPFSVDFPCVEFDLVMMKHLMKNPQEKGIYLHYSNAIYQDKSEFYTVYLDWLKNDVGIDLLKEPIAIAPFAHSCNGGVVIDENAQTDVKGLFAVGEISSCIEGANRLGGNSVGGSLVFSKRAVRKIAQNLSEKVVSVTKDISLNKLLSLLHNPSGDENLTPSQVLNNIRQQMTRFANVYRTPENLVILRKELHSLENRFQPLKYQAFNGIEIYFGLKTAQCVVSAMIARQHSLGSHFIDRLDCDKK